MAETEYLRGIHDWATRHSTRPAFRLAGDQGTIELSFGGLVDRVRKLGSALRASGLKSGERVGLLMENRPAWPVAYMAAWYADLIIVPIDPALEPPQIAKVIRHAGVHAVLTSTAQAAKIGEAAQAFDDVMVLDVDGDGDDRAWDGEPRDGGVSATVGPRAGESWTGFVGRHPLDADWSPESHAAGTAATIMYTSGTTGNPKGVVLSRAALQANIDSGLSRIVVYEDDNVLGVLPLFHSLPLMANCLGPVAKGACVTYLSELNPDRIIAAFPRFRVTAFACVPLFFYRFHGRVMQRIDAMPPLRRRVARLLMRLSRTARRRFGVSLGKRFFGAVHEPFGTDLRMFVTGGAKFDPRVYEDFLDLGFNLVQGYGLTEASAVLTAHAIDDLRGDTVGPPVDGVEIRLENPNEAGIGEVLARTPSRMLGYYRNDEATVAVIDDEWLRTGDLGRFDGTHLQITGRAKDMIVLASGKNIYPEDLESHYGQSQLIDEIAVLGIDDPERQGAERLHAVIVPDSARAEARGQTNIREMVKWEIETLGLELPSPQRISSLEIRTEPLPRTTTRKLKRFELKAQVLAARSAKQAAAEPTEGADSSSTTPSAEAVIHTETATWETDVLAVIAHYARRDTVTPSDHLDLDLGLESLDRVEIHAEIEDKLGVSLPREEAATVQTVEALLDVVRAQNPEAAEGGGEGDRWARVLDSAPTDIEPYLRRRPLTESFGLAALWSARALLHVRGLRIVGTANLPLDYPFVLAPNHLSYVDPFLLAAALPARVYRRVFFVGYSEYFSGMFTSVAARFLRTVPIDQSRNLEKALQAAAEGLRREMVLGIFPEGARSGDGELQEFRRGVGILARVTKVPVVPVGICGTYQMWPRGGKFRLHRVAIAFGAPLAPPEGDTREDEEGFVLRLRDRVAELTEQARATFD